MTLPPLTHMITPGMPAPEFVQLLPDAAPQVAEFTFVVYPPSLPLTERLAAIASEGGADVMSEALEIQRQSDGVVPYWESVLAAAWASRHFDRFALEATRHDPDAARDVYTTLRADELADGALQRLVDRVPDEHVLALDSRCTLRDGTRAHLPLMDFRMLPRSADVAHVVAAVRAVGQRRGAVLHSGRSYHFYGVDPLSQEQWQQFCARCLLLSPLTDARYIAHRLLAGAAALRITSAPRKPNIPYVEALL